MDGVRRLQWRYIPGIPRIRETSELYFLVLFPSAPLAPPRPSAHPSPHNPPSVQTPSNCPAELLKDHCSFANILCRSLTIILIRMQIYYKIHPPPHLFLLACEWRRVSPSLRSERCSETYQWYFISDLSIWRFLLWNLNVAYWTLRLHLILQADEEAGIHLCRPLFLWCGKTRWSMWGMRL